MNINNIFTRPNCKINEEITELILNKENIRIEKIISDGNKSGWYNQDENEFVCLLSGDAELEFKENNKSSFVSLNTGDTIYIEKHKIHRVTKTTKCNWLCIFFK